MNTEVALESPAPPRRRTQRSHRVRIAILALLSTLGLLGASTVVAAPASAVTYGVIGTCLKANGGAYLYPAYVEYYSGGSWHVWTTVKAATSGGCVALAVPAGYTWRFEVVYRPFKDKYLCTGTSRGVYVATGRSYVLSTTSTNPNVTSVWCRYVAYY